MFKQLSNRVSAKTIEETYTDNDVEHVIDKNGIQTTDISAGYDKNSGFTFDYPMRWLNDASDFKAIGIRRLNVIPTSHVIGLWANIKYQYTSDSPLVELPPCPLPLSILSENTFEEIAHDIIVALNTHIGKNDQGDKVISFTYKFDYKTGDFTLSLTCPDELEVLEYNIEGDTYGITADANLNYFLKFLNQERTAENRAILTDYSNSKSFHNVWDRSSLQFHASFSNNRRSFIGLNKDFYENPSVFYDPPTNSSNFWIRFTTDGVHQILPRYCRFYIGLCFVRNYKNSLVTK